MTERAEEYLNVISQFIEPRLSRFEIENFYLPDPRSKEDNVVISVHLVLGMTLIALLEKMIRSYRPFDRVKNSSSRKKSSNFSTSPFQNQLFARTVEL